MHCALSSKARIAVAIALDIHQHGAGGAVALPQMSQRLSVSLSYLQQIVADLRRCGLLQAVRGPGGGYRLARRASDISVADIVTVVDDDLPAGGHERAALRSWAYLNARLLDCLASVSVQALAREQGAVPRREAGPAVAVEARPAGVATDLAPSEGLSPQAGASPKTDAAAAPRRGISSHPVLMPIKPKWLNSVFAPEAVWVK